MPIPLAAAQQQVRASHGHSLSLAYCSTSKCPPLVTQTKASLSSSQGHPLALTLCNTSKCPFLHSGPPGTSLLFPWTSIVSFPLQDLQMPVLGGKGTRAPVPLASTGPCSLQPVQMPIPSSPGTAIINGNSSVFALIVNFRNGLEQGEKSTAVFSVVVVLVDGVIPVQVS